MIIKMSKTKTVYGISTLQGGIVFEYQTHQGNLRKAMFSSVAKAEQAIDRYLQKQYINDFIVCVLGDRVDLVKEDG